MKTTATNRKLRQLLTGIKNGTLLPRPEFQRRLVWANKHKIAFLQTVVEQYPFPEIYLASGDVNPDTGEGIELLVDGQQRITTLYQYFVGSDQLRLPKDVRPYADLPNENKLAFLEYEVVVRDLGKISILEIKEIFKRINSTNYALNAMEISNARYEGELKSFAEKVAQHPFFEVHSVFSGTELRRMHDLRFALTLVVTLMSAYFNRDDELEEYLKNYNDEFEAAENIEQRLGAIFAFIDRCEFPSKSRAWKKTDLFTLIVELDRVINKHKREIDISIAGGNLAGFYDLIDRIDEVENADILLTQYHRASLQATNDRISRVRRGEVIQLILSQSENIDWSEWSTRGGADIVDRMIRWFFENYEDPANGVPYESAEGGYQYIAGGPYDAEEVLSEEFDDLPDLLIEAALQRIHSSGWEWVKIGQY
ncbi:MAG: DUF262 domain-containing protein [Candidatus Solibacter sp.]